jgi:hypothetical protein
MGEVVKLPKRKIPVKRDIRNKGFPDAVADPHLRAALLTLYENDEHLARAAKLNLMEVCKRLETLEAIVFAQSILIAELRGRPLTPKQQAKLSRILKYRGNRKINLD